MQKFILKIIMILSVCSSVFANSSDHHSTYNRILSKLAPMRKVGGDSERRTAVYTDVHEDSSTESTNKFSIGVEFGNNSNDCLRYIDDHHYQFLLDLTECKIQDSDISFILSYLSQNPDIKILFLDENNIGPKGGKLLASELILDYLGIDDNHIGLEGSKVLAENKFLFGVSLSNNYIGTHGAIALAKSTRLENITVSNNDIQPEGIEALANNAHVKVLEIAGNVLNEKSMQAIINNKNIKGLDVSYTNIHLNDVITLLDRPHLESLSINGLHLGDQITPLLAERKTLNYLDIADNNLTSEGVNNLVNLLHEDFVDLNISHNPIGDQGVSILSKINLSMLPFLSLEDTNLSDVSAIALSSASMFIMDLNIEHNHLSAVGIDALEKSSQIGYFDASYNDGAQQAKSNYRFRSMIETKYYNIDHYCMNRKSHKCLGYLRKKWRNNMG